MKKPSQYVKAGPATDIDSAMTPMIDVVFLLLVFFVWTASFAIVEQVMPSQLSQAAGKDDQIEDVDIPEPADFENLVIRIKFDGALPQWFVKDQPLDDLAAVKQQLMTIAEINNDAPVILYPDQEVPLEHIVNAWDAAKLSGFAKVQFAVSGGK